MKNFISLFTLLLGIAGYAQVGVNTQNPQGPFHVDGAKDNAATGVPSAAEQMNDVIITSTGGVGVGTLSPVSKLEVNGASTNTAAYNAGSGMIIDYSLSNLAYTTASAGAFTLNNVKDGGTYTLSVRGTTAGTSTFTAPGFTVKYANNRVTTAGRDTLYTLVVMGTILYVYTNVGF